MFFRVVTSIALAKTPAVHVENEGEGNGEVTKVTNRELEVMEEDATKRLELLAASVYEQTTRANMDMNVGGGEPTRDETRTYCHKGPECVLTNVCHCRNQRTRSRVKFAYCEVCT